MRPLLALLLLTGAFAAGCGGDDNDSSGSDATSTPAATAEAEPTETTAPAETTEEDAGGGAAAPENLDEAIQQCKDGVEATPQISEELKADLTQLCEDAADGDPEELKDIARETCERVIIDTVPEGDQRDIALKQCESAGQ